MLRNPVTAHALTLGASHIATMRSFVLILTVFGIIHQLVGQGTEQRGVLDPAGLVIDSSIVVLIKGEWVVRNAVQSLRDSTREIEVRYWRIFFMDNDSLKASACDDCFQKEGGKWRIVQRRWLKTEGDLRFAAYRGDFQFGGDWMVYKITNDELILGKKLTTSGNWQKTWTFERVR